METILLMFSGGLDSTYALYHYLTGTDYPIHVHHISIHYPHLMRWKMEDRAARSIIGFCQRKFGRFAYSESRFDLDMNLVGLDLTLQLLVASKVAPNIDGERVKVALGHCMDDIDSEVAREHARLGLLKNLWISLRHFVEHKEKLSEELDRPLLSQKLTKKDILEKMPDDLLRLCWSCRKPQYIGDKGFPCGGCHTCMEIEKAFPGTRRRSEFPNLIKQWSPKDIPHAPKKHFINKSQSVRRVNTAPMPLYGYNTVLSGNNGGCGMYAHGKSIQAGRFRLNMNKGGINPVPADEQ